MMGKLLFYIAIGTAFFVGVLVFGNQALTWGMQ